MLGFWSNGDRSLYDAFLKQVQKEFEAELAKTTDNWQRRALEKKMEAEAKRRMKEASSSQSLWNSN
jgi:hypothetical protein